MSHALLLRLFLSPSFFSVHVALKYLMLYADNIGITYYLTRRLRELDTQELCDVWGFICHLLVTRPSNSRALECFVVEIAQRSTHIAMMTLFYMQASLQDLSACPQLTSLPSLSKNFTSDAMKSFFADLPSPASVPYSGLTVSFHSRFSRKRVKPRVEPALVGIGLVALQQGRAEGDTIEVKGASTNEEPSPNAPSASPDATEDDDNASDERWKMTALSALRKRHVQLDTSNAAPAPNPYQSLPSIPSSHLPLRQSTTFKSQSYLLRSHYCPIGGGMLPQILFLLALEEISNHLLVVPKPARISALRAEGLSACQCGVPLPTSPAPYPLVLATQPHHRIVRISPGESVLRTVLHIEILRDDLDFDPTKRGNKEVVKRIVTKESEEKGTSRDLIAFTVLRMKSLHRSTTEGVNVIGSDGVLGKDSADIQEGDDETDSEAPMLTLQSDSPTSLVQDEQEVDLVEQLYGAGQSLRGPIDLEESIVLPPPPKNRELELAAWSRAQSIPISSPLWNRLVGRTLSLDDYSERMRTAATITPLNGPPGSRAATPPTQDVPSSSSALSGPLSCFTPDPGSHGPLHPSLGGKPRPPDAVSAAPTTRMREMISLEEERMARMREGELGLAESGGWKTAEDEGIIKRELSKADPSAVVFSESWAAKKSRIRHASPYGHLANWDCISVIVKTGGDLRQEQVAVQLIREFGQIWQEEKCQCWVRYFRILITGASSGLVETINDAVSIHSIKKAEYARRLAEGRLGHSQRNFAKSLAGKHGLTRARPGYSIVTYLLQIKDRHNGNILLDREGHMIHIDFGFMLSNSPGNIEYVEVLGGIDGEPVFTELVDSLVPDSTLPCFAAFGEQTANQLRDRFQPALTHSLVREYVDRLIDSSSRIQLD
ncbi:kinase-like protein [Pisolithus croceorrhizus]|nr:kinase-like protein [Pisolithus croceorrhizus]